jgi:hypothetical protein
MTTTPPDADLRQRIETALRAADDHWCSYMDGTDYRALADALLPLFAAEREAGRRDGLREGASVAHDEGTHLYDDMGQKAAAGAWYVRDRLRARADAIQGGGQA